MLTFDVKRKINTLRDILVGKVPDPKAQVEQITIALIYKFMDDMDIEGLEFGGERQFFTGDYEKYAWTEIMKPENSASNRALLYGEGIDKMVANPNIPKLFRDIFRGAYVPYRDPETLNMFLKEVSDFTYDNSEDLGNAFEYLLSIMGSQGDAGQFRTPRHIIDMMVEIVDPKKNETILDPACGTAGFLISAYRHIIQQNKDAKGNSTLTPDERKRLTENFAGYDISPDMVRLSRVNMYLHKFVNPNISEYDTLTSEEKWDDNYDVILANPPFMTPKGGIIPHGRYRVKAKRSEVLFVDYIAEHLNPTGRAAIVVPEGIVFQSATAYKQLRKYLVDENMLYGVISLPAGVFNPYSGVKTSILLIDRSLAKAKDQILFVKLNNDGYDLGAQRREIEGNEIPEIIRLVKAYQQGDDVSNSPLVTMADRGEIAQQDYILVGERYKNRSVDNSAFSMTRICDICQTSSGGTPTSSVKEYYDGGTINWLKSGEVGKGRIYSAGQKITEAGLSNSSARIFPINTVLVAMYGATAGQVGLLKVESATNQAICGILPSDNIIPEFLYYILLGKKDYLISLSTGGAQPNISQKIIKELKIPLPPISVQEEIVAELDSYQKIIDGARSIVENYKPSLLSKSRWETVKLGEICELNPRKTEVKDINGDVSFVPMAVVSESDMYFSTSEERPLKDVYTGYTYFRDQDVLLAKVTPCFENGKSGLAKNLKNGIGFGSSEFFVLRAKLDKVLPEYIYYVINSNRFIAQGTPQMTGTGGLRRLTKDFVLNYPVSLPPLEEQRRIVSQTEEEIAVVEQNKRLISLFEQKIKDKIADVWGE